MLALLMFYCRGYPVVHKMFSNIPGLYSPGASSNPPSPSFGGQNHLRLKTSDVDERLRIRLNSVCSLALPDYSSVVSVSSSVQR